VIKNKIKASGRPIENFFLEDFFLSHVGERSSDSDVDERDEDNVFIGI
jgi:hypothetical protein